MTKTIFGGLMILCLVGATAGGADEVTPPWAAKQLEGGAVRVAVPAPEDPRFAHLAWPKAVRTGDGTIVLAYLAGVYHGGSGCPAVSLSSDNGRTFTEPNVLMEFGKGKDYDNSGNVGMVVAEDGAVVLLAMAHKGTTSNTIFGWRSVDNGKNWTPVNTSALGPNITGSVTSIAVVPGVGLMATGHYRQGSKPALGIWVSTSNDNGRTWGKPVTVSPVNAGEPALVVSGDRLLIFIRSKGLKKGQQYLAVSDDQGKTWKTDTADLLAQKGDMLTHPCAFVNPENPGEIIAITTERPLPGQTILWRGDAKTLEFKPDRTLLEFPRIEGSLNDDFGYTTVVPNGKGKGLMFYYHGQKHGACSIWVTDITY